MVPPTADGGYGDRWSFTVNVVEPDGTDGTFGPITSDPVGRSVITIFMYPIKPAIIRIQVIFAERK